MLSSRDELAERFERFADADLLDLLGLVCAAPLLWALFRYAFCSRTASASPAART